MNNKKRVLIVAANGLGRSGVPNVIYQVVKCLSKSYLVDLVVFNDDDYFKSKILDCGVEIFKVDTKEPKGKFKRFLWRLFRENKVIQSAFKNIFTRRKYDIVHSFREYESGVIFKCAKKYGIANRIIHCNNEFTPPKKLFARFVYNSKMALTKKFTTFYIGVSTTCCQKSYGNVEYAVLNNTYNEAVFKPSPYILKNDELVLMQVATFSKRKNQLFAIEVFKDILKEIPNARLLLVGTPVEQEYQTLIIESIKKQNLHNSINVFDGSQGFLDLLPGVTYFLLPSLSEAAPITIVELQACGIMCFVSDRVTKDVDCGGVCFLDLSAKLWADTIVTKFKNDIKKRNEYNVEKFSSTSFNDTLLGYYNKL